MRVGKCTKRDKYLKWQMKANAAWPCFNFSKKN